MANKQVLSVVAASILAAAFTFTGCGSSSSSDGSSSSSVLSSAGSSTSTTSSSSTSTTSSSSTSESTSSSSSVSSDINETTTVRVSDDYIVEAMVTIGTTEFTNTGANTGEYEFTPAVEGERKAVNGVSDENANGVADNGEAFAPMLTAPAGYANVNPFTTLLATQTIDQVAASYPLAATINITFDIDVVAEGNKDGALDFVKEVGDAAVEVAFAQSTITPPVESSSSEVSSESSSSEPTDSITPPLANARAITPDLGASSSSEGASSSSEGASSSNEAPSNSLEKAKEDIAAATSVQEVRDIVNNNFATLFGTVGEDTNSSSSAAVSSDASESSSSTAVSSTGSTITPNL